MNLRFSVCVCVNACILCIYNTCPFYVFFVRAATAVGAAAAIVVVDDETETTYRRQQQK